jgi:hypothetical protein
MASELTSNASAIFSIGFSSRRTFVQCARTAAHLATTCLTHVCSQAWQSEAWGTFPARLRR